MKQFKTVQQMIEAPNVVIMFKATTPKVLYIAIKQYQERHGEECFQIAKIGALYYAYIITE